MGQLIALALATFASEDIACLAAGALIANGTIGLIPGILACAAGIYAGDLLLFFAGRAGAPIARRFVSSGKLELAGRWMAERGAAVVLLSRFTPGLRLPTYLAAGILRTRFWTFNSYFLAAALIWTPVLVGSAAYLGRIFPAAPFAMGAAMLLWHSRRLARYVRWEFWPPWLAYLPLIPYLLWLAVRHRSLTLFPAANPGMPSGGFVGESKSAILAHLPRVPGFVVVQPGESIDVATLPVVLKPDVGERGAGVSIARTQDDVRRYLAAARTPTIVQQYVGGLEFGVFYVRHPGEPAGRIFSITEKRFPEVIGDGRATLRQLILRDTRAARIAEVYLAQHADRIPAPGERVRLVEIGSHCRGAIFLDGSRYETPALRAAIDAVAQCHPGFYFGRFDLRSPSLADFQAGRFSVLELNGVSAEATHIYDPALSVWDAYDVLFRQWRLAFRIGAANRSKGACPMTLAEFARLLRHRRRTQNYTWLPPASRQPSTICVPRAIRTRARRSPPRSQSSMHHLDDYRPAAAPWSPLG
jgi:membrane protein DedA with SNARE-associated domain